MCLFACCGIHMIFSEWFSLNLFSVKVRVCCAGVLTNCVLLAGGASVMDLRSSTVTLSMLSTADPE